MNRYNGTIKRLVDFRGNVDAGKVKLKAKIAKADSVLNVKFNTAKNYITNIKNTTIFNGIVTRLNLTYRFIFAKSAIITKSEAKTRTAPAVEIEADSEVKASKSAPISTHPAMGIAVNQKEKVSVYAKLVAYRRAGLVFIKKILMPHTAKLTASPGVLTKYREIMGFNVDSKAGTADSTILESRNNKFATGYNAVGSSAPAQIVPVTEAKFTETHTAKASTAAVVPVDIDSAFKISHIARLYAWFLPDIDGHTMTIYQTFSGVQSGDAVEIDTETESAYWANAFNEGGVLNLVFTETVTQTGKILEVV